MGVPQRLLVRPVRSQSPGPTRLPTVSCEGGMLLAGACGAVNEAGSGCSVQSACLSLHRKQASRKPLKSF